MPTPVFICGAECGIAATGTAVGTAVEHWATATGSALPAISTTTINNAVGASERSFQFAPDGTSPFSFLIHTLAASIASPATVVARFYIYFATLPDQDGYIFRNPVTNQGVWFDSTLKRLYARVGTTNGATGRAVSTGQWFLVDCKMVRDATRTTDMEVNGTPVGQASDAGGAGNFASLQIGWDGGATVTTADFFIDDFILSATSGDYPIGAGYVAGLYPSADGAHNFNANTDFDYEDGSAVATSATDTWTHLQNPLSTSIGVFMADISGATSEYLCWVMENLPASADTVNGVACVSTNHDASTTSALTDVLVVDDSATSGTTVVPEINHLGGWSGAAFSAGVDLSETTIIVPYSCRATGVATGAWTVANVNDLAVIFGGTDVTPDIYCDGVCLEVSHTVAAAADDGLIPRRPIYPHLLPQ